MSKSKKKKQESILDKIANTISDVAPIAKSIMNPTYIPVKIANKVGTMLSNNISDEGVVEGTKKTAKTIGKTALTTSNYVGQGVIKGSEEILDTGLQIGSSKYNPFMQLTSKITGNSIESMQSDAKDLIKKDATKNLIENTLGGGKDFNQRILDKDSLVKENNIGGKVAKSIGQQLPSLALGSGTVGKLGETISLGTMGVQSYGGSVEQAYQQEKNRSTANKYGVLNAAIETATEKMFAGVGGAVGKGPIDDVLKEKLTKKISNKLTKELVSIGFDATGEGVEEIVSDVAQPYILKLSGMSDKSLKELKNEQKMDDFVNSFVVGALSGGIMSGTSNVIANNTLSSNERKLVDEITNKKVSEHNKNKFIDQEVQKRIDNADYEMNSTQKEQVRKNVLNEIENGSIQAENVLDNKDVSEIRKSVKKDLKKGNIDISQIQEILGDTDFSNDRFISNIFNEENKKSQSFSFDTTNIQNEKVRNLYESAQNKINDTTTSHKFVDAIAKLVEKTDRNYQFTNNQELKELGLDIENKSVNGLMQTLKNGEQKILINMDSKQALNTVLGHETTHLLEGTLEYQDLQDSIIEYAKTKGDYDGRLADLTKRYDGIENVDINSELTADLVGDYLFTDEKFINDLAINKPTLAAKIKNVIDNLVKTFKRTNEESRLKELQEKFNKALDNVGNNTNTDAKYMMTSIEGMNNGIKVNDRYLNIKNRYDKAIELSQNDNYSNEDIRQETGWFQDKEGNWEFEVSDHKTKFKINPKANTSYKMSDLFEASTLYDMYPELKDIDVTFKKLNSKGRYNEGNNKIFINNDLINTDEAQGTLLHEIQHYIQKEENLPKGTNLLIGNEQYANSKGEIEAADIKNRRNMTVAERKAIAPESSKKKPVHPNREAILNHKRNVVEKITEKLYNKFGEEIDENIKKNTVKNNRKTSKDVVKIYSENSGIRAELDNSSFSNNKYSVSTKDSEGRTLSKNQQEYFKNSKVRDEDGNLEGVYHGTSNDIAPTGDYKVFSKDIKQVQNSIQDLSNQINDIKDQIAPVKYSAGDPYADFGRSIENDPGYNSYIENMVEEQSNKPIVPYTPIKQSTDNYIDTLVDREETKEARRYQSKQENKVEKPTREFTRKDRMTEAWDAFQSNFVNRNRQIDKISKITGNYEIKYKGDRLNNVSNEVAGDIFTAQTDNYGNAIGKSLDSPFEKARELGLTQYFDNYLKHQSNIERHRRGKGSMAVDMITSQKYVQAYERKYPVLKELSQDVYTYNQNLLNNAVENGLITPQFRDSLNAMYGKYVPFYEKYGNEPNISMSVDEIYSSTPIRRAKGGTDGNLLDVEQAMIKQTYSWKNSITKNDLYKEIGNTIQDKADIYVEVDPTTLENTLYSDENGKYLTYFDNGEQQTIKISDDLYKELSRDMEHRINELEEKYSIIAKPLQKISGLRGKMLTSYNPSFIIRNPLKDVQDALINTKNLKGYIKNYKSSFTDSKRASNIDKYIYQLESLTGQNINEINPDNLSGKERRIYKKYQDGLTWNRFLTSYGDNAVEMQYGDEGIRPNEKNNKFLNKLREFNNFTELMSRYPEFKQTIQNGGSFTEALYNAREITTNFGRGGTITKALNRNGATFLNASVQGMDKFIRNFSGQNGSRAFMGAVARAIEVGIVPTILNHLLHSGDDDYENLKDYIKDNYYLFKTGKGEFIRIPKGRMVAVIGSAARRTMEYAGGDNSAYEGLWNEFNSQIGVNNPEENNVFAPLIQAYGSKNGEAWYGGDLIPSRLQNKPADEQYDESTDALSIKVGQALGISPYKLNYVLDQYSGGIGDIVLPMMTKKTTNGAEKTSDYIIAPIKDAFQVDSTTDNKYPGDIYDLSEKLSVKSNSEKTTNFEKVQSKYINSVSSEMNKLYAKKREIQNSDLSNSEKLTEIKAIQDEINSIAKSGLESYQEATMSDTYALIGNKEFRKNTKDEWKPISKSDAEKLANASSDEKSEYFYIKNDISSIKEEYKDLISNSDKIAKKREIINSILDSDLSDSLISSLYSSYYSKQETTDNILNSGGSMRSYLQYEYDTADYEKGKEKIGYLVNAHFTNATKQAIYENTLENISDDKLSSYEVAMSFGIDINNWLKLKSQTFESDKYANGKTVSGSKKSKIMSYIQSLKLNITQKALLTKLTYSSFNLYNNQLNNYIENMNITANEKYEIAKKIGLVKEYGK